MKNPPSPTPSAPSGAGGVLAAVRAEKANEEAAALRQMVLTVEFAAAHRVEDLDEAATLPGTDHEVALAGQGAPLISEFAVVEYAAATGRSADSARVYVGDCMELAHRLPKTWGQTRAGRVAGWRARRIAAATKCLPVEGAAWVDSQVAPVAGKIGPGELDRVVTEAIARFDPERTAEQMMERLDARHVDIAIDAIVDGAVCNATLTGVLDVADALDLDATLSEMAADLAALGCADPLGARRAQALGQLARGEQPLDYSGDDEEAAPARPRRRRREVVLHVRLTETALHGLGDGIGTLTTSRGHRLGQVTVEQVQDWCNNPGAQITVKPILDLDELIVSQGYQPSARLRDQTTALHPRCVFPWCTRPAMGADLDHIVPWQPDHGGDDGDRGGGSGGGGRTDSHGIAPLCRLHHRAKTHGGWHYTRIEAGEYLWTSPHRLRFHVDGSGTTEVTGTTGSAVAAMPPPGHRPPTRP